MSELYDGYIRIIVKIYDRSCSIVKQGDAFSDTFPATKSLKAALYLQLNLKSILRRSIVASKGIEMNDICLTMLLFADDQMVLAKFERDTDYMFRKLTEYEKWGLKVNKDKVEYSRREEQEDQELQINNVNRCEEFKYLEGLISEEGTSRTDKQHRIMPGLQPIRLFPYYILKELKF